MEYMNEALRRDFFHPLILPSIHPSIPLNSFRVEQEVLVCLQAIKSKRQSYTLDSGLLLNFDLIFQWKELPEDTVSKQQH